MLKIVRLTAILCLGISFSTQAQPKKPLNPFFVFNNGLSDDSAYNNSDAQVALAASIGFDGVEKNMLDDFANYNTAVKKNHLQLYTIYLELNLDDAQNHYDHRLDTVFQQIQGTQAMPWIFITSKKFAPSSSENDSVAVRLLQQIGDVAANYHVKIMLYHHMWTWLQSVEDAVRVAEKVNRKNVGITFNLPHFLALHYYQQTNPETDFKILAEKAKPYLFAISVCGADFPPVSGDHQQIWNSLIQPLGEGQYDTYNYLKTFWDLGFTGPVGLQCYNIRQDKTVHLAKSMHTWLQYKNRYASGN